jgi:hypothetical protein
MYTHVERERAPTGTQHNTRHGKTSDAGQMGRRVVNRSSRGSECVNRSMLISVHSAVGWQRPGALHQQEECNPDPIYPGMRIPGWGYSLYLTHRKNAGTNGSRHTRRSKQHDGTECATTPTHTGLQAAAPPASRCQSEEGRPPRRPTLQDPPKHSQQTNGETQGEARLPACSLPQVGSQPHVTR